MSHITALQYADEKVQFLTASRRLPSRLLGFLGDLCGSRAVKNQAKASDLRPCNRRKILGFL